MNTKFKFIKRNLSLFSFLAIYVLIAVFLLFLESFQAETQWNVITALAPFFLLAAILDFIVSRNRDLQASYQIFAQLIPIGVFLLFGLSIILDIADRPPIEAFNYLFWIFIVLPFFITSNLKDNYRRRMLSSLIGTGLVGAVYIQLSTMTDDLYVDEALIVYLICIFLMFYAASGLKKPFYISTILGLFDAAILLIIWTQPATEASKINGLEYNIAFQFELLLLANLIICILICLIAVLIQNQKPIIDNIKNQ